MPNTIYIRMKALKDERGNWQPSDAGAWQYVQMMGSTDKGRRPEWQAKVEAAAKNGGRGFQYRLRDRSWSEQFDTIAAAEKASERQPEARAAAARGITIEEYVNDPNRLTLRQAVEKFLTARARKAPRTVQQYTYHLEEFLKLIPRHVKFVDQLDAETAEYYLQALEKAGAAPKTICNKALSATSMLKLAGVPNSSKLFNTPTLEEEPVEIYSEGDLKKLFAEMNPEEYVRYSFFLYTACREAEVAHAQWADVDWKSGEYIVRSKQYVSGEGVTQKFTTKNHSSRRVPLTRELVDLLKRRKAADDAHPLWIFPNTEGQPEGHFLRKFKKIAFKAGLNCGHCEGGRCKKDPEGCAKHYLHRLRKTRATFWHREGIDVRTIQYRLSHTSLETTQRYLGIQDSEATREIDNRPML